jgi:hypothetical protein
VVQQVGVGVGNRGGEDTWKCGVDGITNTMVPTAATFNEIGAVVDQHGRGTWCLTGVFVVGGRGGGVYGET